MFRSLTGSTTRYSTTTSLLFQPSLPLRSATANFMFGAAPAPQQPQQQVHKLKEHHGKPEKGHGRRSESMRACMVAYTFYETDNRVRRYAETLVRRGDQVDAIVLRRAGQSSFETINGVNVYRIQRRVIDEGGPFSYLVKLLLFFIRSMWLLTLRHLKKPYDLIHVHPVPDFQVFATLVPRLMGAKVILDIHDIVPEL